MQHTPLTLSIVTVAFVATSLSFIAFQTELAFSSGFTNPLPYKRPCPEVTDAECWARNDCYWALVDEPESDSESESESRAFGRLRCVAKDGGRDDDYRRCHANGRKAMIALIVLFNLGELACVYWLCTTAWKVFRD